MVTCALEFEDMLGIGIGSSHSSSHSSRSSGGESNIDGTFLLVDQPEPLLLLEEAAGPKGAEEEEEEEPRHSTLKRLLLRAGLVALTGVVAVVIPFFAEVMELVVSGTLYYK